MSDQTLESVSLQHTPSTGIPALVVSGFLGAGKTTLIRNLLQDAQNNGHRMAVVSNEFGALGIDQALFGQGGDGRYVELEGGCVCCQLSNELLTTLHDLWERHKPDRMIVETSGVALPFETLVTFWREPITQWVGEALAVVVVNAEQLAEGCFAEPAFVAADSPLQSLRLLLTEIARLSPDESGVSDYLADLVKHIENPIGATRFEALESMAENLRGLETRVLDDQIEFGAQKPKVLNRLRQALRLARLASHQAGI